jgi:hypothetical protein
MIARNARRIAVALTAVTALAASGALAAPVALQSISPNTCAEFVLAGGDTTGYATVNFSGGLLGSFGSAGSVYGSSTDITSQVEVSASGLPEGVTVSLSSASMIWDGNGQNIKIVLAADGTAVAAAYDGEVILTNKATGTQLSVPMHAIFAE